MGITQYFPRAGMAKKSSTSKLISCFPELLMRKNVMIDFLYKTNIFYLNLISINLSLSQVFDLQVTWRERERGIGLKKTQKKNLNKVIHSTMASLPRPWYLMAGLPRLCMTSFAMILPWAWKSLLATFQNHGESTMASIAGSRLKKNLVEIFINLLFRSLHRSICSIMYSCIVRTLQTAGLWTQFILIQV